MIEESPTGEVTETVIAEDYVTITQRIPTRRYYARAIAPIREATAIRQLHEELRRFLSHISYRIECSRWYGKDTLDVSEEVFTFCPMEGWEEPYLRTLSEEIVHELMDEMRMTMPLFAELSERWIEMTPSMREPYLAIAKARREAKGLQEQMTEMANDGMRDGVDAYLEVRSKMYDAQDRQKEATDRYMEAVKESLGTVARVAERHMDEAYRHVWDGSGYDEWLGESVADKDTDDGNKRAGDADA